MIRQRHEMSSATTTTSTTLWTTTTTTCQPRHSGNRGAPLSPSKKLKTPSSSPIPAVVVSPNCHHHISPSCQDNQPSTQSPRPTLTGEQVDDLLSEFFSLAKIEPSEALLGVPQSPLSQTSPPASPSSSHSSSSSSERSRSPCVSSRRHRRAKRTM